MTTIKLCWADGADRSLPLPAYESAGAAGADLRANLPEGPVTLAPGARTLISTGLHMAIPQGFEVQIRPRSGLALKHGITLINSPGTIDSDYRGIVGVIMGNMGQEAFTVEHGMRIAQMVIAKHANVTWEVVKDLNKTERDEGGFGSTGTGS